MSIAFYTRAKERFENTKPIRGRTVECKPWGSRSRDWEQVVQQWVVEDNALDMGGQMAYGAKLYDTNVCMFMPNGDILVTSGGWDTPTTAEFLANRLPYDISCHKQYNKLWIGGSKVGGQFPIGHNKSITLIYNAETDSYTLKDIPKLQRVGIDRKKSKEASSFVKAFKDYATIMLKLSDGWLLDDLASQHMEGGTRGYWGGPEYALNGKKYNARQLCRQISEYVAEDLYAAMSDTNEENYPKLLCMIAEGTNPEESRVVRNEEVEVCYNSTNQMVTRTIDVRENRYSYKTVRARIDYIVRRAVDVTKLVDVEAGKIYTNLA